MARFIGRGSGGRSQRSLRQLVTQAARGGLIVLGVVASLALTADAVRAGGTATTGLSREGSAPLSLSVPIVITRPGVWLAQWSATHVEAASLVLFGLGLFGCAQIVARRRGVTRPVRTPAPAGPGPVRTAVAIPSRVSS